MSITAYTGVPGSGKSYEVVASVILPALCKGRRVITNLAGFDNERAATYCVEKLGAKAEALGSVVSVDDDAVTTAGFMAIAENEARGSGELAVPYVLPGDLVVIDECWRYWGSGKTISPEHQEFFTKHRHFTHAVTGVSTDLVIVTQDLGQIKREVKNLVELTFQAEKLKAVGLNSLYKMRQWTGGSTRGKPLVVQKRRYKREIFPIYSSYSAGTGSGGTELTVDSRQNYLRSGSFLIGLCGVGLLMLVGGSFVYRFFHQADVADTAVAMPETPTASGGSAPRSGIASEVDASRYSTGSSVQVASLGRGDLTEASVMRSGAQTVQLRRKPALSAEWRIGGYLAVGSRRLVILINKAGQLRYEGVAAFSFEDGRPVAGLIDDERVTPWTGGSSVDPSAPATSDLPVLVGGIGR